MSPGDHLFIFEKQLVLSPVCMYVTIPYHTGTILTEFLRPERWFCWKSELTTRDIISYSYHSNNQPLL